MLILYAFWHKLANTENDTNENVLLFGEGIGHSWNNSWGKIDFFYADPHLQDCR
jgi:hypothetical protein